MTYTVAEAEELIKHKKAKGDKTTTIKVAITFNTGIIKTSGNLAIIHAAMQVLAMRGADCTSEVETEVENNPEF